MKQQGPQRPLLRGFSESSGAFEKGFFFRQQQDGGDALDEAEDTAGIPVATLQEGGENGTLACGQVFGMADLVHVCGLKVGHALTQGG